MKHSNCYSFLFCSSHSLEPCEQFMIGCLLINNSPHHPRTALLHTTHLWHYSSGLTHQKWYSGAGFHNPGLKVVLITSQSLKRCLTQVQAHCEKPLSLSDCFSASGRVFLKSPSHEIMINASVLQLQPCYKLYNQILILFTSLSYFIT